MFIFISHYPGSRACTSVWCTDENVTGGPNALNLQLRNLDDNAEVSWSSPTWNHFSTLKHQYVHYRGYWVYYSITKQSGWVIRRGWMSCQCWLFVVVCLLCIPSATSSRSRLHSSIGTLPSDLWPHTSVKTISDVTFWTAWMVFSTCRFSLGSPKPGHQCNFKWNHRVKVRARQGN